MDDKFQKITDYTPEVQDMRKNNTNLDLLQSYEIYMAVYDYNNNKIDTLHYGLFDDFYPFDANKQNLIQTKILKQYEWLK